MGAGGEELGEVVGDALAGDEDEGDAGRGREAGRGRAGVVGEPGAEAGGVGEAGGLGGEATLEVGAVEAAEVAREQVAGDEDPPGGAATMD